MNGAVRLKYATSQQNPTDSYTFAKVKVKNIAFAKQVEFHGRPLAGPWSVQTMNWTTHHGNYDVFSCKAPFAYEFFVKYTTSGQTYIDDDNGQYYHLLNFNHIVGGGVMLNRATARRGMQAGGGFTFDTSWIEGEIYAGSAGSTPSRAGIRWSVDGWLTWQDTDGTLTGNATEATLAPSLGTQLWGFKTPELNLNRSTDYFVFAIYYLIPTTNKIFWDNNFGQDYRVSKIDGSTIQ
jgi:carbohydrate/starch-binding protein with CBM21 domain